MKRIAKRLCAPLTALLLAAGLFACQTVSESPNASASKSAAATDASVQTTVVTATTATSVTATSATTEPTVPAQTTTAEATVQTTIVQTTTRTTTQTTTVASTTVDLFAMELEPPTESNAAEPLQIATYDGYNQPCHPKVLYFADGWNGYRYWMAYTPYPYCEDSLENPCIAVSDDGYTWFAPEGIRNPVTGYPPTFADSAHYSDPHLLMNGNTMELWFRYYPSLGDGVNADSNGAIILRTCSTDGVTWSEIEEMYCGSAVRDPILSPVVELIDGTYTMWYAKRDGRIYRTSSSDGFTWSELTLTDLIAPNGVIWHQDMIRTELGYEIVFCARPSGAQSNLHGLTLYYAASYDGVHFTDPIEIVAPRVGTDAFDNASIYRASIVKIDGFYRIYYSSMSERYIWKISLCEGESISSLKGMGR